MNDVKFEIPEHIARHEPKRSKFNTDDEFEEALAFYKHRFKPLFQRFQRQVREEQSNVENGQKNSAPSQK